MTVRIINADVMEGLRQLPDESVHCVVTSPPYWALRDYGVEGQIGLEPNLGEYLDRMVAVFREVMRVLREDGTLWLNIGDAYANDGKWGGETGGKQAYLDNASRKRNGREKRFTGLKPKDLMGMPWRVAFALQADGWWLRSDIIWAKPNPMPESVTDRPTKAHEYVFLLTKSERYYYDAEAIKEASTGQTGSAGDFRQVQKIAEVPGQFATQHRMDRKIWKDDGGRNKRSVWTIATNAFPEAHFATFPPELPEICIKAGCPVGGTVLDPFSGAGTTCLVADRLQRNAIGIELNPEYAAMSQRRLARDRGGLLDLMEAAE